MAIREAIRRSGFSGTRRWIVPEHVQAIQWPVNPVEPEVSWPMYQTLTPNHFIQRWGWEAGPVVSAQFLRDLFEYIQDEELGGFRWYEEPFYAKWYWREASSWVPPETGLLTQLVALLRRAFVAVTRQDTILEFFNIYGQKVDNVDIPVGAGGQPGEKGDQGDVGPPGPAGRRGTWWFVGHGDPATIAQAVERDLFLDVDTGNVWQMDSTRRWRRLT